MSNVRRHYDVENSDCAFTAEVKNRFSGLQLVNREPGELGNDIREIVKDGSTKRFQKRRRRKLQKLLPQHAREFVDERRKSRKRRDGVT